MAKPTKSPPAPYASRLKDWHALLVIAGTVVFFFRDILLKKAYFWEDFIYYYYPTRNFAATSLAGGEIPLWNPYTFNGMPFLADIQTAVFYVPNLLLTLFVSEGKLEAFWLALLTILHFFAAAVFMFYVAKYYGLSPMIALFSGLVYAFSGFMIAHGIHYTIISSVTWFPLIVLLFSKCLDRKSPGYMIAAGAVLGMAILAGFPQITLYIVLFLLLFWLFEFYSSVKLYGLRPSLAMVVLGAGIIVVAVGLTAFQLLPTVELAPYSQRAEITYEKSLVGSMSWEQLLTFLVPKYFGSSGAQGSNYWGPGNYYDYWETCGYVGIVAIAGVIVATPGARKSRRTAFLVSIAAFSVLYALGDDFVLHEFFFSYVPGFDKFRNPGRMLFLFTFAAALLSGFGLQSTISWMGTHRTRVQRIIGALLAIGILLTALVRVDLFQPSDNSQVYSAIHTFAVTQTNTAVVLIVVFCGILFLSLKRIISPTTTVVALTVLQFIDMNLFGFSQNNGTVNPDDYFNRTSQIVRPLQAEGRTELFRVNSRESRAMILDRNQGMIDRIFLMEGYTPLVLQRVYPPGRDWSQTCDMLNAKYRIAVDEQQHTMSLRATATYLPRAYLVHSVKVIQHDSLLQAFMRSEEFDHRHTVILEENPRFPLNNTTDTTDKGSATITSYNLNSITINVSTSRRAILVLSEIYYPGWYAYVNGMPAHVYRANWCLRAIEIEPGEHTVVFEFKPASFRTGLWISLFSIALSLAIVYFSSRRAARAFL